MDIDQIKREVLLEYGGNGIVRRCELEDMEWVIDYLAERELLRGVPKGYVLVPKEPTAKQLDHAVAFALNVELSGEYTWSKYMKDLYKGMIYNAPNKD